MLLQPGAEISLAPGQTVGITALLAADKTTFGYARRYHGYITYRRDNTSRW
ncbi:hypothetical protein ACJK9F_000313 [Lelliottia nimipressuralis]|uniref:hypothetical protein n=1 Tax=Lelliottia nimipressuralis TaxID=69220 RepID=UPI0039058D17